MGFSRTHELNENAFEYFSLMHLTPKLMKNLTIKLLG